VIPGARVAAAIEVLDRWLAGDPAERALTNWGRANRFAGSGDRAAIRDHVFDAIRCRRSCAAMGGAETGRGLMIGALRLAGEDPSGVFTGQGHAPSPLTAAEVAEPAPSPDPLVRLDCPEWIAPRLKHALGEDFEPVMALLRHRAPVFLRVNRARASRDEAGRRLNEDGIASAPHPLSPWALEVTENARRVKASAAFREGLVELQDAASQAVVDALAPLEGVRALDYCAGGGGKSLALAALGARVYAHDADPARMSDLPERAARAGACVRLVDPEVLAMEAPFDLVLADAPCTGSGAWRRQPEVKWRLDPARLDALVDIQAQILDASAPLVTPSGRLAYATCSLLREENEMAVDGFLARHPDWRRVSERRFTPLDGGDGFFVAILERD
jgi:16S rRNA (cytosine967-C5)-methyltransferase